VFGNSTVQPVIVHYMSCFELLHLIFLFYVTVYDDFQILIFCCCCNGFPLKGGSEVWNCFPVVLADVVNCDISK
jgi:hypothetical protein